MKKFMTKPNLPAGSTGRRHTGRTRQRIVRTQLDPEMPYAQVTAPPSYEDTLTADRIHQLTVQQVEATTSTVTEDEDSHLIIEDPLSNEQ